MKKRMAFWQRSQETVSDEGQKHKQQRGEDMTNEENEIRNLERELLELQKQVQTYYLEHPDKRSEYPDKIFVKSVEELEEKITEYIPKKVVEEEIKEKKIIDKTIKVGENPLDFSMMSEIGMPKQYVNSVFQAEEEETEESIEDKRQRVDEQIGSEYSDIPREFFEQYPAGDTGKQLTGGSGQDKSRGHSERESGAGSELEEKPEQTNKGDNPTLKSVWKNKVFIGGGNTESEIFGQGELLLHVEADSTKAGNAEAEQGGDKKSQESAEELFRRLLKENAVDWNILGDNDLSLQPLPESSIPPGPESAMPDLGGSEPLMPEPGQLAESFDVDYDNSDYGNAGGQNQGQQEDSYHNRVFNIKREESEESEEKTSDVESFGPMAEYFSNKSTHRIYATLGNGQNEEQSERLENDKQEKTPKVETKIVKTQKSDEVSPAFKETNENLTAENAADSGHKANEISDMDEGGSAEQEATGSGEKEVQEPAESGYSAGAELESGEGQESGNQRQDNFRDSGKLTKREKREQRRQRMMEKIMQEEKSTVTNDIQPDNQPDNKEDKGNAVSGGTEVASREKKAARIEPQVQKVVRNGMHRSEEDAHHAVDDQTVRRQEMERAIQQKLNAKKTKKELEEEAIKAREAEMLAEQLRMLLQAPGQPGQSLKPKEPNESNLSSTGVQSSKASSMPADAALAGIQLSSSTVSKTRAVPGTASASLAATDISAAAAAAAASSPEETSQPTAQKEENRARKLSKREKQRLRDLERKKLKQEQLKQEQVKEKELPAAGEQIPRIDMDNLEKGIISDANETVKTAAAQPSGQLVASVGEATGELYSGESSGAERRETSSQSGPGKQLSKREKQRLRKLEKQKIKQELAEKEQVLVAGEAVPVAGERIPVAEQSEPEKEEKPLENPPSELKETPETEHKLPFWKALLEKISELFRPYYKKAAVHQMQEVISASESFKSQSDVVVEHTDELVNTVEGLIEGDVRGESIILEIRSVIKSDVVATNYFYCKQKAVVFGNVYAKKVIVEGTVRGDVQASQSIEVKDGGCVFGNVKAPSITLDAKGYIAGNLTYEKGEMKY